MSSYKSTMATLRGALLALGLMAAAGAAMAQSAVTLTARPATANLPDGQSVPMWGYGCTAVSGTGVSCTAMNGATQSSTAWQPPLIRAPAGKLTITLNNTLPVPTSIVIDGQLGGGLGEPPSRMASPAHAPYGATWPGAPAPADAGSCSNNTNAAAGTFCPPAQADRVRSFGTEVAPVSVTTPVAPQVPSGSTLTWDNLRPGTYLIHSGTEPSIQHPMGLYGVLVVTDTTANSAYGTSFDADVPLLFSEIDPVQNIAVDTAVNTAGFSESATRSAGSSVGAVSALSLVAGGSGYTSAPTVTLSGGGGTGATATASITNTIVSIGSITNSALTGPLSVSISDTTGTGASATASIVTDGTITFSVTSGGAGYTSPTITVTDSTSPTPQTDTSALATVTGVVSGLTVTNPGSGYTFAPSVAFSGNGGAAATASLTMSGICAGGVPACYPPAVNYSPRYYLINGTSFDRSNLAASTLSVPGTAASGNVLLRIVNAGQRLHVPAIVGANMTLLAEDGFKVPSGTRKQSSIPMPPGKTFDATIQPTVDATATSPTYAKATLPVYDRELSLSTNNQRDGGMQAYIAVNGGAASGVGSSASGVTLSAPNPTYTCVAGTTLSVSPAANGVLAGAVGASGVSAPTGYGGGVNAGNLTLNSDGTFTYVASALCGGNFSYLVNGTQLHTATILECDATKQDAGCKLGKKPKANDFVVVSSIASRYTSPPPGVLAYVTNVDGTNYNGLALNVPTGGVVNPDGSFAVAGPGTSGACPQSGDPLYGQVPANATCVKIPFTVQDAQNQASSATAYVAFQPGSGLTLTINDGPTSKPIAQDYRWIIEEDRTFWVDPKCQVNDAATLAANNCPPPPVESLGYNFHSAHMPVIATGCVGTVSCELGQKVRGNPAVCDVGNGKCRDGVSKTPVLPGDVYLDPKKRYYVSILPGDAINPTISGFGGSAQDCATFDQGNSDWALYDGTNSGNCGHEMGGAQLAPGQTAVTINLQEIPLKTAKISAFVFEDDNPLNGENDAGGGVDVIAPNEPGLGGFELKLFDQAGQLGDATGQITYDEFNEPVSNSLAGYIDPVTGKNACPITARTDGLVGMVPTCPKYEEDGKTPSPLAGQAVIANLYPGLYEIQAFPAADRIARGEQWLQTNTLDGGKPHEAFIIPSEPGYFQEFGPGGFHVAIGFANPAIINARKAGYCSSSVNTAPGNPTALLPCNNTLTVEVTNNHMSRTPDQRTYDSETYDHYSFTQCYVSIGPSDAEDFAFENCVLTTDKYGKTHATATFTNMPPGVFKMTVFDQWNDIMLDGLVGTIEIAGGTATTGATTAKTFPVTQWRTDLYTRTYIDDPNAANPGVSDDSKPGLALVNTNIRYRDGSIGFFNNTDLNGYAGFNEVFPLMNWLVVETSQTRFKPTWTHVVYDAGGPVDGSAQSAAATHTSGWSPSSLAAGLANTDVRVPLPAELRVPGAKYCNNADCPANDTLGGASTGTLFPPQPFSNTIGWQGLLGQDTFIEFGVKPFKKATPNTPAENGGITGQVVYASTRPFDDPSLLLQLSWEPGIPNATVNLYSKTVDASGKETLTLVDTTQTASWDDWAQGFRKKADGTTVVTAGSGATAGKVPNMNCPGQDGGSPFFATLKDSKQWLDSSRSQLAYNSQFKCYDGWSQLNQAQPAPYDGYYKFPSVTAVNETTGKPAKSNCTICTANPDDGNPMLPAGTYVVEIVPPTGYELVKEEDKNILMGDVYVAPVTQQFGGDIGLGNIFIMPDQAAVGSAYNAANPGGLNTTTDLGSKTFPRHEGDTGSIEAFWPCVGTVRQVPDYNSEFPGAGQAAPFAGAMRPLCDRKEVTLADESSVLAKFYLFSSTHIAGHFTGTITNDFASEFDPFSPQFGEKFGPPNLPVGLRDFNGNEVARVYGDQWGIYNGLYFSTWSPNPPNPTGYAPQMSIACMNDPGPIMVNGVSQTDPSYNPAYSNFCYEQPFMPGETTYMDTPVIPTQSFADGYNLPDTEYPDNTPAISSVTSDAVAGPWIHAIQTVSGLQPSGETLTINALGDKQVQNPMYTGPNAGSAPFNKKTITRHYGFGDNNAANSAALVAPDGVTSVALNVISWTDKTITATVPATLTSAFNCRVQQAATPALCGQLVITRGDNGKRSIDAITVTMGGSEPWLVTEKGVTAPSGKSVHDYEKAFGRMNLVLAATNQSPIQVALDSADPGDLILVQPGTYRENLIMWKPVRLQGVGAGAVTVNADAHPAGHMDQWRRQMVCVFGLTLQGVPNLGNDQTKFDPSQTYTCPDAMFLKGERIPFEAITGWQAAGNGNLAQVLQEPTLMGAYEGAGITVVGRGIRIPANSTDFWGNDPTAAGAFPDGSRYLGTAGSDCTIPSSPATDGSDYGTSNYRCNPSRIDGLSILNSSQGGGGIFVHGWGHNIEIANNRVSANHGTLAGALNLGNGETPPVFVNDGTTCGVAGPLAPLCPPLNGTPAGAAIPFGFNTFVRIHHNMLWNNASIGDALFTGTPAGGGAVTVSAGGDDYSIDHNWIAGNLSTGDGGGVQQLGVNFRGRIANNVIMFNQSTNPTLPTNGGGLVVQGANEPRTLNGTECGGATDTDCPPGLGDGTGDGLVIDANLIYGNSAESGTGGGLALEMVNGSEVIAFPLQASNWYGVTLTNNIIANNVAGYDGGGVSLRDTLKASLINNTIVSNDTTASAGVLFKTLGAINSSSPPPGCNAQTDPTLPQDPSCLGRDAPHGPQPSGLVTMAHTQNLNVALNPPAPGVKVALTCPSGFGYASADCEVFSRPRLVNDMFWQNRTFSVDLVPPPAGSTVSGTGLQSQQNLIALSPQLNQSGFGSCTNDTNSGSAQYWDIGLRTDDVQAGLISAAANKLAITYSLLTGTADIGTAQETISDPTNKVGTANPIVAQICNGARTPPEACGQLAGGLGQSCHGFNAPPGASETTSLSTVFVFDGIKPTATVDEGHNWLNLTYGPLTLARPGASTPTPGEMLVASASVGLDGAAYSIGPQSVAIGGGLGQGLDHDFFGNARPTSGSVAIGAVERTGTPNVAVSPTTLALATLQGTTSDKQTLTLSNTGNASLTGLTVTIGGTDAAQFSLAGNTCGTMLNAGATCTIDVQFTSPANGGTKAFSGNVTITGSNGTVTGSPVALTGQSLAPIVAVDLTSLAFSTLQGTTSGTQTLTLGNTGNTSLTGLTVTFGGTNAAQFTRSGGSCGTTLGAGATCTIDVQFTSPANGGTKAFSGNVAITGSNGTVTGSPVSLTGQSLAPIVATSPTSLAFSTLQGTTSAAQTLTLSNTGNTGLTGLAVTIGGTGAAQFSFTGNTCGTTLNANATCTISVQFTAPANSGGTTFSGNVTITGSNGTVTGSPVPLAGQSQGLRAPIVAVSPTSLTFSTVQGTTSAAQILTLSNTGTGNLTGLTVTFGGTNPAQFTRTGGNCGATLIAGANCTIAVRFTAPANSGGTTFSGNVALTGSNGIVSGSPVSLTGQSRGPIVAVSPTSLTFSTLQGTTSGRQNLTLSNTGTATLTGLTVTIGGAQFTRSGGSCGTTLAAGTTCTIGVRFVAPANSGGTTYNGSVTITGGNGAVTGSPVSLTGQSQVPTFTATVNPNPLAFGSLTVGANSTLSATVTNTGTAQLTNLTYAVAGTGFTRTFGGTCGGTLNAGATCTIAVRFTATNPVGPKTGTLTVNGAGTPIASTALTGTSQ